MRKGAGILQVLLRIVCFCCAVYVLWYAGDAIRHRLDSYRDRSCWEAHLEIQFDTLYEELEYEVLGAFQARALGAEEDGFRYYDFYQADSQEEFTAFYEAVKALSLYDTGVTAAYGDTFLSKKIATRTKMRYIWSVFHSRQTERKR